MNLEITKATLADLDDLAEMFDEIVDHLNAHINYPMWIKGEYPARHTIQAAIEKDTQYICRADGRAVGAFVVNNDPQGDYAPGNWSLDLPVGEFAVLHTLAVRPDAYGIGAGKAMVKKSIEIAKELGYPSLRLDLVTGNDPAVSLYEKCGFVCAGKEIDLKRFAHIPAFDFYEYNF